MTAPSAGPAFASVGRAHLAYDRCGTGHPVVLLHAGVTDRGSWSDTIERLQGVDALAYDRRGFGQTRYEAEPHARVDDLFAVMDAVGFDRAVLVGSSQGGAVAIEAALDGPDRVEALLLLAPGVSGLPGPDNLPTEVAALVDAVDAAEAADDLDELNRLEAAARRLEEVGAELRLIDRVAHLPQLERPGLVAEAVHELISRLPPRSSGRSRR